MLFISFSLAICHELQQCVATNAQIAIIANKVKGFGINIQKYCIFFDLHIKNAIFAHFSMQILQQNIVQNNIARNCYRRMPAEWERQSLVQLTWPHEQTDWLPYLDKIVDTMTQMAIAIAERQHLLIVSQYVQETEKWIRQHMTMKQWMNTKIVEAKTNDTWARDHAFITVTDYPLANIERTSQTADTDKLPNNRLPVSNEEQSPSFKALLDFRFNGWGKKFPYKHDNEINKQVYGRRVVDGKYENHEDLVLEGGAIESDGRGTVMTTQHCMLAAHRNYPLTKKQLDQQLRERLGAERIVWLHHGKLKGDDTDGHIDTIVRFAPNDTILYVKQDDTEDEHYEDFLLLQKELRRLKTLNGKPYNLLPLPFPRPIFDSNGKRLPATYANFLVINGAVLLPTYNQTANDLRAYNILAKAYPDREIIPIDSRVIIQQHGSIHCLTMQYY